MNIETFLLEQNKQLQELYKAMQFAGWMVTTTGTEEWNHKLEQAKNNLSKYYSNKELFAQVEELHNRDDLIPLERRQVNDLYNNMVKNQLNEKMITKNIQLTNELTQVFNNFRPTIDGQSVTNNEIQNILKQSKDDNERQKAWLASKQIGKKIEASLLALIEHRNEEAKALGFNNYYHMNYETQELGLDHVFTIFHELKELSDQPFKQIKQDIDEELAEKLGILVEEIRPWHYPDPFLQVAPPTQGFDFDAYYRGKDLEQITKDTFSSMGLDIADVMERSDLYPRENKYPYGYCTDMGREGDTRILMNIDTNHFWLSAMLHEFGHAAYDKYINRNLPFLLRRYAHVLTTEGIAMFFGRFSKYPEWLERFLKVDPTHIQKNYSTILTMLQREMLVAMRWYLTFTFFERELYENPQQDLNKRWWELVQEIQFVNPPEEVKYPDWAAKMHFSLAPVSYQNYILGELTASQLQNHIENHVSKDIFTPQVGQYLINHVFYPGATLSWAEKIGSATGSLLNPKFFVEQFVRF